MGKCKADEEADGDSIPPLARYSYKPKTVGPPSPSPPAINKVARTRTVATQTIHGQKQQGVCARYLGCEEPTDDGEWREPHNSMFDRRSALGTPKICDPKLLGCLVSVRTRGN